jgi:hypothetical protein
MINLNASELSIIDNNDAIKSALKIDEFTALKNDARENKFQALEIQKQKGILIIEILEQSENNEEVKSAFANAGLTAWKIEDIARVFLGNSVTRAYRFKKCAEHLTGRRANGYLTAFKKAVEYADFNERKTKVDCDTFNKLVKNITKAETDLGRNFSSLSASAKEDIYKTISTENLSPITPENISNEVANASTLIEGNFTIRGERVSFQYSAGGGLQTNSPESLQRLSNIIVEHISNLIPQENE